MKSKPLFYSVLDALVKGAVVVALVALSRRAGWFGARRSRTWKERVLADVLAPVYMQLDRTKRAYLRYKDSHTFMEAKVIRDGNLAIRDTLLANAHLIPPSLFDDAAKLIEHYDRWYEEFERLRLTEKPELESRFVFPGPQGLRFTSDAEARFQDAFRQYSSELYHART